MKKLAIASAIALMGIGSAYAQVVVNATAIQTDIASLADASDLITAVAGVGVQPVVNVTAGAINLAALNGAIDISGTNIGLSSMANNVTATATATATTSTADAYAIAGAKLGTTVIGAMNSGLVEVMGKVTEQQNSFGQNTGLGSLAMQDGGASINTTAITQAVGAAGENVGNDLGTAELLGLTATSGLANQVNLNNLTSAITSSTTTKVSELQAINVFNTAINAASLDGGIKIAATIDDNAWFLNPQTGVVNLANVAMATTVIGAMNSATTRLGANLSTPTVTVK